MPGPTTELLNEELREVRDGFARTNVGLAEVRTEVRVITGFAKVFGVLVISGLVSGLWWAATLSNRMANTESRLGEIGGRLDKIDARFDHLESTITKAIVKP